MNHPPGSLASMVGTSKRLLSRVLALVERRLELLMVEVQEERERFLHAFLLMVGLATFGLLAGITLTIAVVVLFWERAPFTALLVLLALYGGGAVWMYARLRRLRSHWETCPATRDQLRKDCECVNNLLR